jgi:hypothetical protein
MLSRICKGGKYFATLQKQNVLCTRGMIIGCGSGSANAFLQPGGRTL